jgi:hypothetical protein
MLSFVDFYIGGTEDLGLLVCGVALLGKGFIPLSKQCTAFILKGQVGNFV